jgi:DNA polymerase-1
VGIDAEGLELRCLGHYMARYDGGAYSNAVVNGKKEDKTDVHSVNQRAIRFNSRGNSKTFIYALIYGAGDYKLGLITYDDFTDEQRDRFNAKYPGKKQQGLALTRLGKSRRESLMTNLPALGQLVQAVKAKVKSPGYLFGLDGRKLHIRAQHSALNTLLQSAGAVVMKKALVLFEASVASPLRSTGGIVEYVANVHDEFQIETEETHAEFIGKSAADCITRAGEHFNFRCPLAGSYGVGDSWRDTH